ncbi:MAG: hypothetical protein GY757_00290, partial [bacterium]|nr:hypothetical protein [bacterium]
MKRKRKNDYDSNLAAIRAIGAKQIKKPHNISVSISLQEADTLYHWSIEDIDALTVAGQAGQINSL